MQVYVQPRQACQTKGSSAKGKVGMMLDYKKNYLQTSTESSNKFYIYKLGNFVNNLKFTRLVGLERASQKIYAYQLMLIADLTIQFYQEDFQSKLNVVYLHQLHAFSNDEQMGFSQFLIGSNEQRLFQDLLCIYAYRFDNFSVSMEEKFQMTKLLNRSLACFKQNFNELQHACYRTF
eukprot:TRINITY_DN4977_c0_g2_i1.p1 TRINITY_DN4977_c0_g2~~TRINITY_DN4977_c0_g2_i1.p1  ORF type:complete len:177 (+),score=4.61 TRINITY_DN4977_c0_g2_i1:565-1095(+)